MRESSPPNPFFTIGPSTKLQMYMYIRLGSPFRYSFTLSCLLIFRIYSLAFIRFSFYLCYISGLFLFSSLFLFFCSSGFFFNSAAKFFPSNLLFLSALLLSMEKIGSIVDVFLRLIMKLLKVFYVCFSFYGKKLIWGPNLT